MSGTPKPGFSLIEILIAIALVAVMAVIVLPNIGRKRPAKEREAFVSKLNTVTRIAWQNALTRREIHKVTFDFQKNMVWLEQATGKVDAQGEPTFEPAHIPYLDTELVWPDNLQIKHFFIEDYDETKRFAGGKTGSTWFFVMPDGLTQKVTIELIDVADRLSNGRPRSIRLTLNPFNAQFTSDDISKQ